MISQRDEDIKFRKNTHELSCVINDNSPKNRPQLIE